MQIQLCPPLNICGIIISVDSFHYKCPLPQVPWTLIGSKNLYLWFNKTSKISVCSFQTFFFDFFLHIIYSIFYYFHSFLSVYCNLYSSNYIHIHEEYKVSSHHRLWLGQVQIKRLFFPKRLKYDFPSLRARSNFPSAHKKNQ